MFSAKSEVYLILTLTVLTTISCAENFKSVDSTAFNAKIAERRDISTVEKLIEVYYDYPANEGDPNLQIVSEIIDKGIFKVILIDDWLEDDSQKAVKIVMLAELKDSVWIVHEIKKNWKCYDGRGHVGWGTKLCN